MPSFCYKKKQPGNSFPLGVDVSGRLEQNHDIIIANVITSVTLGEIIIDYNWVPG